MCSSVRRILVVDDQDSTRDLLVQLLRRVGFATREAANGHEAIEMFHRWQPHLILMDIRMPVMDGLPRQGLSLSRLDDSCQRTRRFFE